MSYSNTISQPGLASRSKAGVRSIHYIERVLLLLLVVLLPVEDVLPSIGSRSIPFILFVIAAGFTVIVFPQRLLRTALHPVFFAAAVFLGFTVLMELTHDVRDWMFTYRTAEMFLGALCIATLCRDRDAVRWALVGAIIAGIGLSMALISGTYGRLISAEVSDFHGAGRVRAEAFSESGLDVGLNRMSFLCAEAAIVGLALLLHARGVTRRGMMLGVVTICCIGTFLPFSRGGVLAAALGGATVLLLFRGKRMRTLLIAAVLMFAISELVPDAVFHRMVFTPQTTRGGKLEGRTQVYTQALTAMPEYATNGIGAGKYWEDWAMEHGLGTENGPMGVHNVLLQVWIFWGAPVLISFLVVLGIAARCLPWKWGSDPVALGVIGFVMCASVLLLVSHVLYAKPFSVAFGMVVGADLYVWPRRLLKSRALQMAGLHPNDPHPSDPCTSIPKPGPASVPAV
jgi:hypothetical protein